MIAFAWFPILVARSSKNSKSSFQGDCPPQAAFPHCTQKRRGHGQFLMPEASPKKKKKKKLKNKCLENVEENFWNYSLSIVWHFSLVLKWMNLTNTIWRLAYCRSGSSHKLLQFFPIWVIHDHRHVWLIVRDYLLNVISTPYGVFNAEKSFLNLSLRLK